MKLGLGTVQFGMNYGITNRHGKPAAEEVANILDRARASGLQVLDTAPAYGDAERALGEHLRKQDRFRIVTKTPAMKRDQIESEDVEAMVSTFRRSLELLRVEKVYGLLIHDADDFSKRGAEKLVAGMQALVRAGQVEKIGVSVYTAAQIDRALAIFRPDIVQLPLNVFDQRLIRSGHLKKLKDAGAEIHARSVFLQGLLLERAVAPHEFFNPLRPHFARYQKFLSDHQLGPSEAALKFVENRPEIDAVLVGVSTLAEFEQVLQSAGAASSRLPDMAELAFSDETILNPAQWKLA